MALAVILVYAQQVVTAVHMHNGTTKTTSNVSGNKPSKNTADFRHRTDNSAAVQPIRTCLGGSMVLDGTRVTWLGFSLKYYSNIKIIDTSYTTTTAVAKSEQASSAKRANIVSRWALNGFCRTLENYDITSFPSMFWTRLVIK